MNFEDFTVSHEETDWSDCLQSWSWLLKKNPEIQVLLVTKFAELFVINDDDEVWFMSSSGGSYEKVADSLEAFSSLLEDNETLNLYFMPQLAMSLEKEGLILGDDHCYGFKIPCVYEECTFEPDNFYVANIAEYLKALGNRLGEMEQQAGNTQVTLNTFT